MAFSLRSTSGTILPEGETEFLPSKAGRIRQKPLVASRGGGGQCEPSAPLCRTIDCAAAREKSREMSAGEAVGNCLPVRSETCVYSLMQLA